jgi:DNA-binding transcriptional LysR family regulator
MQLSSVRIFADVMSLGSFASAARQRDLDPSSISRAIAGLEKELGFRLFQRNRRKLAPTEAGAHYYAQIKGLLEDIERAGQEALDLTTEPRGMLRVTACTSMGQRVLAPLLPKLFEAYPALSLDLVLTDAQVDLVADQIDLAIRFGLEPEGDVIAAELVPRRFRVCASPAYVQREGAMLHPGELSERDCILFPLPGYRTRWRFRNNSGEEVAVPVRGRLLVSHGLTMTQCAVSGLGPALLPDWLCNREIDDGSLVDLFPEHTCAATEFGTAAWMIHPSRSYVPIKVQAFMTFLRNEVRSLP